MKVRTLTALTALLLPGACDREFDAGTPFSGEAALGYITTQLAFGPRVPGTLGHRRTGDWIVEQMRARSDTVIVQSWQHVTQRGDTLPMRNILARIRPDASQRVLYVAHWDTRPVSEKATGVQRELPVPGANDGASGVALLLTLADVLAANPSEYGVDLLFVDGEDYGDFGSNTDVLIGSKYFAEHLPSPDYRPLFAVVWDMIGDADLQIYQEGHSMQRAPEVVSRVWETAAALGYSGYFLPRLGETITDDHLPLLDAGIRAITVIDINYPYHHTPQDLIDRVSPRSLQIVGDVATALLLPP